MYNNSKGRPRSAQNELDEISFVMDELRLFLDTHPEDGEALATLASMRRRREELLARTQRPVCAYAAGGRTRFDWTEGPWPWEREA